MLCGSAYADIVDPKLLEPKIEDDDVVSELSPKPDRKLKDEIELSGCAGGNVVSG